MCCFGEAITLKNICDNAIDDIERYVRDDLEDILNIWDPANTLIDRVDFYGHCPSIGKFKISKEERSLITELKIYVEDIIKKGNIKYFAMQPAIGRKKSNKQSNISVNGTFEILHVGTFFTRQKSPPSNTTSEQDKILKEQLYTKIINILTTNGWFDVYLRHSVNIQHIHTRQSPNKLLGIQPQELYFGHWPFAFQRTVSQYLGCNLIYATYFSLLAFT